MQQAATKLKERGDFDVAILTLQSAQYVTEAETVLQIFVDALRCRFGYDFSDITEWHQIPQLFTTKYFSKPLILILDDFDALKEEFVNQFADVFRTIHTKRVNQSELPSIEKESLQYPAQCPYSQSDRR